MLVRALVPNAMPIVRENTHNSETTMLPTRGELEHPFVAGLVEDPPGRGRLTDTDECEEDSRAARSSPTCSPAAMTWIVPDVNASPAMARMVPGTRPRNGIRNRAAGHPSLLGRHGTG